MCREGATERVHAINRTSPKLGKPAQPALTFKYRDNFPAFFVIFHYPTLNLASENRAIGTTSYFVRCLELQGNSRGILARRQWSWIQGRM